MKLNLGDPRRWITVKGGDVEVEVLACPMTHFERLQCVEMMNEETRTVEKTVEQRGDGRAEITRTIITAPPHAVSAAERFALERTIKDWRGLEDEKTGKPIGFSLENLDRLMGFYSAWADALRSEVQQLNGLGDNTPPDPQAPTEESPNTSSGSDS